MIPPFPQFKKLLLFLIFLGITLLFIPSFVSAKSFPMGYERDRGREMAVSDPLGWPISLHSSVHVNASLDSLPGMVIIRLKPYKPWWKFSGTPDNTVIT